MKRFVTYLYECESGNKSKNVGFIRVNVRGAETTMEVYLRNMSHGSDAGKIYALVHDADLQGIELGEIKVENGQNASCFEFQTDDIMEQAFSINNIEGIGIRLDSGVYIASCWKDEYADAIVRGEFEKDISPEEGYIEEALAVAEDSSKPKTEKSLDIEATLEISPEIVRDGPYTTYEKIDLSQIRNLPSPNWHLATNSFLLHGFWNYGYLVLKKDVAEDKEILSLGVPGVFEKPEAIMAIYFGFPSFEEIPEEMVNAELNQRMSISRIKENQETKTGAFGCWFVRLKI